MADFSQVLLQSNNNGQPQDSVTKLLVNQSPSFSDVQNAYLSTLGRPLNAPVSLGDVLNQARAAKIKEAQAVQGMNAQQQELDLRKQANDLAQQKIMQQQIMAGNTAVSKELGNYAPSDQLKIIKAMHDSPQTFSMNMDPLQAKSNILRFAEQVGAKPIDPKLLSPEAEAQKINIAQASRPVTNVSLNTGNKFGETFAAAEAKNLSDNRGKAEDAVASMAANMDARKLLDSGMITGAGADWILGFGKVLQQGGVHFADDAIANTEAFVATRAKEVGRIIKLFGSGTGLSDADRQYAEKAAAGKITLNEASIRKIMDINDKQSQWIIKHYNNRAAKLAEAFPDVGKLLTPVQMPEATGQTQIPPPEQRQVGQIYTNPNGVKATWTGSGWQIQP